MRIVAALGGKALLRRGEAMTADVQRRNVRSAARALAPLVLEGNQLIVTHGNGPQVGLLALQAAAGPAEGAYPFDILNAESEGMVGYLIEQELMNLLPAVRMTATLLTQTRVDRRDPAFARATKPIGPVYTREEAERLAAERRWTIGKDGNGWRRVVPSPSPVEILQCRVIEFLVNQDVIVICAGGGGIPVIEKDDGLLVGVEAVIDKDLASGLLARRLRADHLLLLTDVDAVYMDWDTSAARAIQTAHPSSLDLATFSEGSMRPKVEAAIGFVHETGRPASIGRLDDASALLSGAAGTTITLRQQGVHLRQDPDAIPSNAFALPVT